MTQGTQDAPSLIQAGYLLPPPHLPPSPCTSPTHDAPCSPRRHRGTGRVRDAATQTRRASRPMGRQRRQQQQQQQQCAIATIGGRQYLVVPITREALFRDTMRYLENRQTLIMWRHFTSMPPSRVPEHIRTMMMYQLMYTMPPSELFRNMPRILRRFLASTPSPQLVGDPLDFFPSHREHRRHQGHGQQPTVPARPQGHREQPTAPPQAQDVPAQRQGHEPAQPRSHGLQPTVPTQPEAHEQQPTVPAQLQAHGQQPTVPAQPQGHGQQPAMPTQSQGHGQQSTVPGQPQGHGQQPTTVHAQSQGHGRQPVVPAQVLCRCQCSIPPGSSRRRAAGGCCGGGGGGGMPMYPPLEPPPPGSGRDQWVVMPPAAMGHVYETQRVERGRRVSYRPVLRQLPVVYKVVGNSTAAAAAFSSCPCIYHTGSIRR